MKYEIRMSIDPVKNVVKFSTMHKTRKQAIVNNEFDIEDINKLIDALEEYKKHLTPTKKRKKPVKK